METTKGFNESVVSLKFNKILSEWNEKAKKLGHFVGEFSETEFNQFSRSAERTPLKEGKFNETKEGKPIAKLMGNFKDYDWSKWKK